MESYTPDSIIQNIINKFLDRGKLGLKKYNTNLDRDDLSVVNWIEHAQEEAMDLILYLEKLKKNDFKRLLYK